ncbi:MAG: hypothetical protein LBS38_02245 [Endomicrobium sp.]|jgi:hypothetical protein|nr:hypothetical protein [Endomicrobium sp.]
MFDDNNKDAAKISRNNYTWTPRSEASIKLDIEKETYGDKLLTIKFTGGHFYYLSPSDSYISGDCGLYAFMRFLRHAELLGIIPKDTWNKYTVQELRNLMVDHMEGPKDHNKIRYNTGSHNYLRRPCVCVSCRNLRFLIAALNIDQNLVIFEGNVIDIEDNNSCLFNRF